MGLFSFFSKNDDAIDEAKNEADLELLAPVSGNLVPLGEVPDLVISEKLIGDGVAIIPDDSHILAPCSGIVSRLVASNNAFAIRTDSGIEVYVTFGIGTSNFTGEGLSSNVGIGDRVETGTPIINIDINHVSEQLESTITSMIVVNSSASIARVISASGKVVAGQTPCTWAILEDDNAQKKDEENSQHP